MSKRFQGGILGVGFNPLQAPNAPTIGTATAGNASVSVAFTAPANVGGSAITSYAVQSSPSNIGATGASSPITVSGLTNGTSYTFRVTALNSYGPSPASGASNSVTPVAPQYIAVTHDTTPFVSAYPWSGSGFGTKFANPATLPTGIGFAPAFSPAGDAIAVAHDVSPVITAYPWSGSGFGTKFANPATLPVGTGGGVAFSPAGDAIAVTHATTPFVSAYPWSGSGFGTKYANPATLPTGDGYGVDFSPAGDAIAVTHFPTPFVSAYPWSVGSGFGTKFANPATLPTGTGRNVAFT